MYRIIERRENEKKCWIYKLERLTKLREWSGRIFVNYPSGGTIDRHPNKIQNGLPILHITKDKKALPFPGFHKFTRLLTELETMPTTWRDELKRMKGVYLLTGLNNKKLYVGSVSGTDGFWGLWTGYTNEKGGGNKGVVDWIRNNEGNSVFQVSILDIASSSDDDDKILEKESSWKIKLNTRDEAVNGLNRN